MADETVEVLKEIAELLRRRVDQEDAVAARAIEAARRSAEAGAHFQANAESMKARQEESAQRLEKSKHTLEALRRNPDNFKADFERRRAEDQQFQQRLLADLEQHNALLSQILDRLAK